MPGLVRLVAGDMPGLLRLGAGGYVPGCFGPAVGAQAVAGPADRLDQRLAELAAQIAHVHVDEVRARIEVRAPGHGQQLRPGQNLARVAGERLQQRELAGGQAERPAADRRLAAQLVDADAAGPLGSYAARRCSSQIAVPSAAAASSTNRPASMDWKVQNRSAGWYR
jgi:hypothetical protein